MSDPTPPDLAALFELERATRVEPPAEVRARVLAAVLSRAVGPGGGGSPANGGPSPTAPITASGLGPIAAASAISIVLGIGIGFLARGALEPDPVIPAVELTETAAPEPITAVLDPPPVQTDSGRDTGPSVSPPPRTLPAHRLSRPDDRRVEPPVLPAGPPPGPTTAQERATIDRARVAVRGGHFHEALVALMGHERRFARGQFAEERERLIVEALVGAQRWAAARLRVEQYRRVYPQGLHRQAVNTLAERIPLTP